MNNTELYEKYESEVRSYCRNFPAVMSRAKGSVIYTEDGTEYIDFFAGAGALNYGHNNDYIKSKILDYLNGDRIMHALDMYTEEKRHFIEVLYGKLLKPRGLDYKFMCCGPTGANGVEAALKLARKVKKRQNIFAFMGAFHGMSMGALSVTSGSESREGAGVPLGNVTFFPYPDHTNEGFDTVKYMERALDDDHSGISKPAAVILETVQAEGGINVAPVKWLKDISELCRKHGILLIVDDVQVGCGRTGTFFSFERAGITPDIVVLSKSISGYGLPMSLVLFKPEYDVWAPAEHNGTFRGFQLAFTAAAAAIEYRETVGLDAQAAKKGQIIKSFISEEILPADSRLQLRGIGMIWGIDCSAVSDSLSKQVMKNCFDRGLILERAGRRDSVVKLLPPLVIEEELLIKGLEILKESFREALKK